ncbi:hypothetical protein [Sanguibacter sp. 25GB23B1]|uniref:hypothetical protein n=1 Tax=unclassified Sanguibacter TaxID=2645534 RepID=UPI0032AF8073
MDGPLRPARLSAESAKERAHPLLLLVAAASPRTLAEAERMGISVLAAPQRANEDIYGVVVHPGTGSAVHIGPRLAVPARPKRPGRAPWSTSALVIRLLDNPAHTQQELADALGVSRVRVTQILDKLDGLVARGSAGWALRSPAAAADWLAGEYQPASLVEETWLTLDPVVEVAGEVSRGLAHQEVRCAISGDVAADVIAPWANPTQLIVYCDRIVDLEPYGLTPSPESSANVIVRVPKDPYILRDSRRARGLPIVHPWRVWIDLAGREFPDAAEALRRSLLSHSEKVAP